MTAESDLEHVAAAERHNRLAKQIVSEIESDGLGLERQFELFQEGMALARFCDGKLTDVQKSVELVLKESASEWKTAPFGADDADSPAGTGESDADDGDDRR